MQFGKADDLMTRFFGFASMPSRENPAIQLRVHSFQISLVEGVPHLRWKEYMRDEEWLPAASNGWKVFTEPGLQVAKQICDSLLVNTPASFSGLSYADKVKLLADSNIIPVEGGEKPWYDSHPESSHPLKWAEVFALSEIKSISDYLDVSALQYVLARASAVTIGTRQRFMWQQGVVFCLASTNKPCNRAYFISTEEHPVAQAER